MQWELRKQRVDEEASKWVCIESTCKGELEFSKWLQIMVSRTEIMDVCFDFEAE